MKCREDFQDSVHLRYHLHIKGLPSTCACGEPFSIDHAQTCKLGGFVNMKHNEVRETCGLTKADDFFTMWSVSPNCCLCWRAKS